ncbi:MAG: ECF transporter S component [Clostridium sp.]
MIQNTRRGKSGEQVRKMVMIAMLSGISIFLGVSGLGFITLPIFRLTIMHIPVIIGGIIEGPIVGAFVGLIFGLFSMYQNITAPVTTSFIFWNPIVALVPRILVGVSAFYIYRILINKFKNKKLSIGIAATLASLVNTIGILGFTYIFYLEPYAEAIEKSPDVVGAFLLGIGLTNGVPEALLSALICIPVITRVLKLKKC